MEAASPLSRCHSTANPAKKASPVVRVDNVEDRHGRYIHPTFFCGEPARAGCTVCADRDSRACGNPVVEKLAPSGHRNRTHQQMVGGLEELIVMRIDAVVIVEVHPDRLAHHAQHWQERPTMVGDRDR